MIQDVFYIILFIWCLLAVITFITLLFLPAPYGKHARAGYGPNVSGVFGWIMMELPAVVIFPLVFLTGNCLRDIYSITFLLLWEVHYVHRTFIYPLRRKNTLKPMPISILILGMIFNSFNTFLNSYWINKFTDKCPETWIPLSFFLMGIFLFVVGFFINLFSDEELLKLRQQGDSKYQIPQNGLYHYISCPNYLGEIIEWLGFSLASLSPATFAFLLWTCANLIPRAISHHAWYRDHFPDYPKDRKAIFPFIL